MEQQQTVNQESETVKTKFCKYCGTKIPEDAIICTACGRQVEEIKTNSAQPNIVINNDNHSVNANTNTNTMSAGVQSKGNAKDKWVSLLLCLFLGFLGAHKFYEGKFGMGLVYIFTCGLFGIGWIIDLIVIFGKPNPYYV